MSSGASLPYFYIKRLERNGAKSKPRTTMNLISNGLISFYLRLASVAMATMARRVVALFSRFIALLGADVAPCTTAIKDEVFGQIRHQVPTGASLVVLEIGAGAGPNLRYYPKGTQLNVVDPNPAFLHELKSNLNRFPDVQLARHYKCFGEDMSEIPSNSIDAVVTTCVFCSVSDIKQVLQEIRRVLVPGGKHYFMEHVLDFQPSPTRLIQRVLLFTRFWPLISCDCYFRDVKSAFERSGVFPEVDVKGKQAYISDRSFWDRLTFSVIRPRYYGVATKR